MNIPRHLRRWLILPLLLLTFLTGSILGRLSNNSLFGEDRRFRQFTQEIFRNEINSNTLNLHYTLAHPEDHGISKHNISLGKITTGDAASYTALENYEKALRQFSYDELSKDNQITFDVLLLYYHTLRESSQYELLEEVLSPGLGIQAQLPILFAEYTFYDTKDIEDYLALLTQTDSYFQSILEFEQKKAQEGYFMNDKCLEGVISQCQKFIQNPEENYLLDIFQEKLDELDFLKDEKKQKYIAQNQTAVLEHVVPAYQLLMEGLSGLKGTCINEKGLCYFPEGRQYYTYLLKSQVGVYQSPDDIRQRLNGQLMKDYAELGEIIQKSPSLVASAYRNDYSLTSPEDALQELKKVCQQDFPALEVSDYEVKYVHKSLEDYLSPAFYLTPPIDTLSPNDIYINQASQTTDLELFTTLAHEGFPGHLYQTQYFSQSDPDDVRYLPNFGGYIEGWATYIESYAYSYAKADSQLTRLLWLNRSINLCLYSMIDLGVHYYGWSQDNVKHYLSNFGITNTTAIEEIYQAILENPANYLKYYLGCLNFMDLKEEMQSLLGDDFDLKAFHQQVLEIGPSQFPVLRKHLGLTMK